MAAGVVLAMAGAGAAAAQGRPDPVALLAAQRQAMAPLAFMDGVWRGTAWNVDFSGQKHTLVQTERVGPFLDGAVKVVEGRGYDADGKLAFNAFATISFNPATKAYTMHSYAQGSVGRLHPDADRGRVRLGNPRRADDHPVHGGRSRTGSGMRWATD